MRILIAEDDVVSSRILRRSLENLGYEVVHAHDGQHAWQLFQQEPFRLVITDWMMPGMDGIELCRRIRTTPRYTYVMLLTARDRREDRLEGLRFGADDFLVKPMDRAELAARLKVAHRLLTMQDELQERAVRMELLHNNLQEQNERLEEANARLECLATTDGLTGLANHRRFQERLSEEVSRARRHGGTLAVLLIDIDHFKHYNDAYGHPAGDEVLRVVAQQMQHMVRDIDLVARYGGEEFAVLLPDTDAASACAAAERIRLAVAAHPFAQRAITLSIGSADSPCGIHEPATLLKRADTALYGAKRAGRNRVVCTDGTLQVTVADGTDVHTGRKPITGLGKNLSFVHPPLVGSAWGGLDGLLQDSCVGVLTDLIGIVDMRLARPPGYSQRLACCTLRLAQECVAHANIPLTPGDFRELVYGALLHDIGNLSIPEAILHKSGDLDAYEVSQIRRHPELGVALLAAFPGLAPAVPIVHCHHEHWNGEGYPAGLQGEDIPLTARIFSVAGAVASMSMDHPGRPSLPYSAIRAELQRMAGSQFDPNIVEAFLRISEADWHFCTNDPQYLDLQASAPVA